MATFRKNPKTGSLEEVPPASQREPMKYAGGSGTGGRAAPNTGGDTWAMNAFGKNAAGDTEIFNGPEQWDAGFGGGGGRGHHGGGGFHNPYLDSGTARPGRIGNYGGVMAPPSPNALEANGRPAAGSLDEFYAKRATDPVTGMSLLPTANDAMQQRAKLQGAFGATPDFQMLGPFDQRMSGIQGGNPYLAAAGGAGINRIRAQRAFNEGLAGTGNAPSNQVDQGVGRARGLDLGAGIGDFGSGLRQREQGGPVGLRNPYLVNEKGPEMFVDKQGHSAMIGDGSPAIAAFPVDGAVVPSKDLKKIPARMAGGGVGLSPEIAELVKSQGLGQSVPNVFSSGPGMGGAATTVSHQSGPSSFSTVTTPGPVMFPFGFSNPYLPLLGRGNPMAHEGHPVAGGAPIQNLASLPSRALGGSVIASEPMTTMSASPNSLSDSYDPMLRSPRIPVNRPRVHPSRQTYNPRATMDALLNPPPDDMLDWQEPDQPPMTAGNFPLSYANPYLGMMGLAANQANAASSAMVNPMNQPAIQANDVRQRMTAPTQINALTGRTEARSPVMAMSSPQSPEQVFQTPYGKASVSYGQPKKETVIEGLSSPEFFQRAANRQGEANNYAQVEKGYASAADKAALAARNLRRAGVKA